MGSGVYPLDLHRGFVYDVRGSGQPSVRVARRQPVDVLGLLQFSQALPYLVMGRSGSVRQIVNVEFPIVGEAHHKLVKASRC